MKAILLSAIGVAFCLLCSTAHSHHAFAMHFDQSRTTQVDGVVIEFDLRNPHSFFTLEGEDANGEYFVWEVELPGTILLRRMGVTQDSVKPGDRISVAAWPNRIEGRNLVYGRAFTTETGVTFGQHPDLSAASVQQEVAKGIGGLWSSPLPYLNRQPALPLNQAGRISVENYDHVLSPATTCEPFSIPDLQLSPYLTEIKIDHEKAIFMHEAYGMIRTIPFDSEPVASDDTGYMGIASAKFDGEVLVIESHGYPASRWGLASAAQPRGAPADVPSSEQKRVVERYSVSEDGQVLTLEYSLDDPAYLTETYSGKMTMNRAAKGVTMYPFDCEVDSAKRFTQ